VAIANGTVKKICHRLFSTGGSCFFWAPVGGSTTLLG